jgi:predicted RNA-binding Zn-ribbon protein involved in translation (DUF1610 family)
MTEAFRCDSCQERVTPDFQIIDTGVWYPLSTTAIKRCPDCGEVLAGL